jgi:hypothetical protein
MLGVKKYKTRTFLNLGIIFVEGNTTLLASNVFTGIFEFGMKTFKRHLSPWFSTPIKTARSMPRDRFGDRFDFLIIFIIIILISCVPYEIIFKSTTLFKFLSCSEPLLQVESRGAYLKREKAEKIKIITEQQLLLGFSKSVYC